MAARPDFMSALTPVQVRASALREARQIVKKRTGFGASSPGFRTQRSPADREEADRFGALASRSPSGGVQRASTELAQWRAFEADASRYSAPGTGLATATLGGANLARTRAFTLNIRMIVVSMAPATT
jgi:hypothetical protein